MTKLSKRAVEAIEVLKNEGYFLYHLETDSYTSQVKFRTRLRTYNGYTVKGIGHATMAELKDMLVRHETHCSPNHQEYILKEAIDASNV